MLGLVVENAVTVWVLDLSLKPSSPTRHPFLETIDRLMAEGFNVGRFSRSSNPTIMLRFCAGVHRAFSCSPVGNLRFFGYSNSPRASVLHNLIQRSFLASWRVPGFETYPSASMLHCSSWRTECAQH